jgi:hypothetical protein
MLEYFTTQQISDKHKLKRNTVQKACVRLGFKKIGRDYWLSPGQVELLLKNIYPTPGRKWPEKTA